MVSLSVKLLSHDRPYTIILVLVLMMSSKNSSTITKFLVWEAVKKLFETLLYRRREAIIYYFLAFLVEKLLGKCPGVRRMVPNF